MIDGDDVLLLSSQGYTFPCVSVYSAKDTSSCCSAKDVDTSRCRLAKDVHLVVHLVIYFVGVDWQMLGLTGKTHSSSDYEADHGI